MTRTHYTDEMQECAHCGKTDDQVQIDTEFCVTCFSAYKEGVKDVLEQIERQICFDAKADEDGRCPHHGGKCYELRQLINSYK